MFDAPPPEEVNWDGVSNVLVGRLSPAVPPSRTRTNRSRVDKNTEVNDAVVATAARSTYEMKTLLPVVQLSGDVKSNDGIV